MTNHEDADLRVAADARLVVSFCGSGSCPTVYSTDRDTVFVQGYAVAGMAVPDGELLVEIPRELLIEAARRIQQQDAA